MSVTYFAVKYLGLYVNNCCVIGLEITIVLEPHNHVLASEHFAKSTKYICKIKNLLERGDNLFSLVCDCKVINNQNPSEKSLIFNKREVSSISSKKF